MKSTETKKNNPETVEELLAALPSYIDHAIMGKLFLYIYKDDGEQWRILYGKWGEPLNWQPQDVKYSSLQEGLSVTWQALNPNHD